MRYVLILTFAIILAGCAEEGQAPEKVETTAAQFRMALRAEPYEPGDALTSGDFTELNLHTFPVTTGSGPKELVSCSDGVVLWIRWEKAGVATRSDPPQRYLMLGGFSYRLCNELVSPSGSSWPPSDWSEPRDVGWDRSWDHYHTPLAVDPSAARSPVLVLQWRWTGDEGFAAEDFLLSGAN